MDERFGGHYDIWRTLRINKIINIFGKEFFENKRVLELACGYGHIGKYFINELKCKVLFSEGREEYIRHIKDTDSTLDVVQINQENKWDLNEVFDIVIHWGVLYHLNNWKQDLECTAKHGKLIFLESEVCDSDDENFELKIWERKPDQAISGIGSRPSAAMIEKHLRSLNLEYQRYDDEDLTTNKKRPIKGHRYDWKVTESKTSAHGQRRFWIVKNSL